MIKSPDFSQLSCFTSEYGFGMNSSAGEELCRSSYIILLSVSEEHLEVLEVELMAPQTSAVTFPAAAVEVNEAAASEQCY